MNYTQDQLDRIQELASIFMPISDIALVLDLDEQQLRTDIGSNTEARRRYRKGKALSKEELLQQEMKLAKTGAPQALENTKRSLQDMEDDE